MRQEVIDWFAEKGIDKDTLEAFGIHEDENGGVVFQYPSFNKKRFGIPDGKRQFILPKNQELELFNGQVLPTNEHTVFIVEGETDAMKLWQELDWLTQRVVGLPGIETWRDEWTRLFDGVPKVFVILDNDEDYNVRARVDKTWQRIRKSLGPKAQRVYLPDDVKDVCDFFQRYDLETLKLLTNAPAPNQFHFPALDFSKEPEPYDWLVEPLIAKGDIALVVSEPNIGKSFLAQSLAVALCNREASWLDFPIHPERQKVLYVDEENPEDVVRTRLSRLGLVYPERIRYVHRGGVRLDRNVDMLLNDAFAFEPDLIVLDSLVRLHSESEDESGAISRLFNDAIYPLARDTGATVLLLHHTGKTESTSSFRRVRGSSDIPAAVDAAFDLRPLLDGRFNLVHFKSRRTRADRVTEIEIRDTENDGVELVPYKEDEVF